ncbi:hypothetical protein UPYG_G00353610 [Umbra pygmaea]|uniref:alpha-N-acetylgalactosaminide alpha-2,6-sialyltransferase n=1 Tax=Umbra pygmaea TaxID=75934 RepID=A0ABD0WGC0_UMBPY
MTKRLLPYTLFIAVCLLLYVLLYGHLSEQSLGIYGISEERNWPEWLKAIKTVYRIGLNNNSLNVTALLNMETSTFVMPDRSRPTDDMEIPVLPLNKDDLSKYPNWTFEDVYLRDNQQRQWQICPESLVNSEDPSFKKAFIPDIQLYLHRKLFNVPEWNRLAHFNNPFGFMSYTNYTEIKEVVDQIPEPRDPLLLPIKNSSCIRCAVVASGGILNGSRMGKAIDAHDYVFRVNAAVTKGYEEDVGNRTSVYIHSAHAIISSPLIFGEFGYKEAPHSEGIKYVLIPEGTRDFRGCRVYMGRRMFLKENTKTNGQESSTLDNLMRTASRFFTLTF